MLLNDKEILRLRRKDKIEIEPFNIEQLGPSSYDLTLSGELALFPIRGQAIIDPKKEIEMRKIGIDDSFIINSSQLVLGSTREYISLPDDIAARIEGRSSIARLGVVIHSTGGFVDAGFEGNLTLEMSNLSKWPVKIYENMRIAQLTFIKQVGKSMKPYGKQGKYQGQRGTTKSKIYRDFTG